MRQLWVAPVVLLVLCSGCSTAWNLFTDPGIYGGLRTDLAVLDRAADPESTSWAMLDLPFSAILDTVLVPVTGLIELFRWIFGLGHFDAYREEEE